MQKLRFAVIGTGFWARFQIAAWKELEGIELVALYNRTRAKAEAMAKEFGVANVYDDVEELLDKETLDFVDIITDVGTHAAFTEAAAKRGIPVICQKPLAAKLPEAEQMLKHCQQRNVSLYVHEKPFKARVSFCSAFPVFENQPFLAELDEFILTDIGSHILDVCRFLFGEVETLLCHVATVNPNIKGEDVANVLMKMESGLSCYAEMSYASLLEYEAFPQTFILIEGERGSLHLTKDYEIHVTTKGGTEVVRANPEMYSWLDPKYALVHASIVDCNRDILRALQGVGTAETTGVDNLQTVRLVHAAYASAREQRIVQLKSL
jgi:predicted dehydrogenase